MRDKPPGARVTLIKNSSYTLYHCAEKRHVHLSFRPSPGQAQEESLCSAAIPERFFAALGYAPLREQNDIASHGVGGNLGYC